MGIFSNGGVLVVMVVVMALVNMTVVIRSILFCCVLGAGICEVGRGSNVNRG